MFQFLRDLVLIPSLWRQAVAAERHRRFRASPEQMAKEEDSVFEQILVNFGPRGPELVERMKLTAPSGRWGRCNQSEASRAA